MAKVIGFNEDVARQQAEGKKDQQRKQTAKYIGRKVRTIKDTTTLKHSPFAGLKGVKHG